MIIVSKRLISIILIVVVLIVGSVVCINAGLGSSKVIIGSGNNYRVETKDIIYYPNAYGIKPNGVLRIEVIDVPVTEITELDNNYKPKGVIGETKILEIPSGVWTLYDLSTNKQIKPK